MLRLKLERILRGHVGSQGIYVSRSVKASLWRVHGGGQEAAGARARPLLTSTRGACGQSPQAARRRGGGPAGSGALLVRGGALGAARRGLEMDEVREVLSPLKGGVGGDSESGGRWREHRPQRPL